MVAELDAALAVYASVAGGDADFPGAGAAGGLGFAFRTFLNGELKSGVQLVLEETGFERRVRDADIIVTGEGRLDAQTVMGKAPIGVARLAKKYGRKVIAFSGCVAEGAKKVNEHGIDAFFPILRSVVSLEEALDRRNAAANLTGTTEQVFRCLRLMAH
jgi:glycerate kinase